MNQKEEVKKILTALESIDKTKCGDGDNLDIRKFNDLSEVQNAVKELEKLGVDRKWLFDNGFQIAGFILTFSTKKVSK
jgi:hypothetical protein